jgi:glycosyltransferase involved in cell wall biosynthesis
MPYGTTHGISVLPGRALFLAEDLSVPLNRRVWQECLAIRRAGLEVVVICPRGVKYDREAHVCVDGIEIYRYPLTPARGGALGYAREYGVALWRTWRLVRMLTTKYNFDVVHACNPPDLLLLPVLHLRRKGARLIFDQHDLVPELYLSRFSDGPKALYYVTRVLERLTFAAADLVISTNESYRAIALTRGHKRPEDVYVVRSAPDLSRFTRQVPDPELKRGKHYLIAYLGVMGPQDGVDHAIRALYVLRQQRDDWHAIFVGDGDVADDMRRLAKDLRLESLVEFTGRIPDDELTSILSTADVCLAPDPKNPLNDVSTMNKILEYMAMSRPIVSYDLKEARFSAGGAAMYATANDPHDFARCIESLLNNAPQRAAMGAEGLARLRERLSWEHSRQALLLVYERALGRTLPRPRRASLP